MGRFNDPFIQREGILIGRLIFPFFFFIHLTMRASVENFPG